MQFFYMTFLFLCAFVGFVQAQKSTDAENKAVKVVGDVVKPSELKFKDGMTLIEAIAEAGGILRKHKGNIVNIYRLIPGKKDREKIEVNIKEVKKGKAENLILQPYDIIEIPPRNRKKAPCPDNYYFCL